MAMLTALPEFPEEGHATCFIKGMHAHKVQCFKWGHGSKLYMNEEDGIPEKLAVD